MITLGTTLNSVESDLFVGRDAELQRFQRWLGESDRKPGMLNVCGPAGIGKSALLRAFRRLALELGRTVVFVDGHEAEGTPDALLDVFPPGSDEPLVVSLARGGVVVLLDSVKAQSRLSDYLLARFLPCFEDNVRVVIAGREALGAHGAEGDQWRSQMQLMTLAGLPEAAARTFLTRYGLPEGATHAGLVRLASGNPLALSLAARVALQQGVADVAGSPEWPLIVRDLAARLLDEVEEPELRPVVSACAVIGQFDESILAAVSNFDDSTAIFQRLCRLSIVRPARRGLTFLPEARRFLAQDLRWRRPAEYRALRHLARMRLASRSLGEVSRARIPRPVAPRRQRTRRSLEDFSPDSIAQLTPREREVIELIAAGQLSNREIAANLVISLGTANLHVKHILHKLGFGNRTALAMWWIQRGEPARQVG